MRSLNIPVLGKGRLHIWHGLNFIRILLCLGYATTIQELNAIVKLIIPFAGPLIPVPYFIASPSHIPIAFPIGIAEVRGFVERSGSPLVAVVCLFYYYCFGRRGFVYHYWTTEVTT